MATILSSFANWVRKTKIGTKRLFNGMKNSWGLYDVPEIALMNKVKELKEETRDGLYGSSVVGSRVIALNPKTLGGSQVMWATSALHEAEHGVNKAETEEAPTRREFMFLGKLYKRGVNMKRRVLAQAALKGAVIAMRQRKRMVEAKDRGDDVMLLKRVGFSDRAATFIAGV
jgi:hypothetical protein